jgi:CRP-like cAMP-binding protein
VNSLLESVPIFAGLDEKALELLLAQAKQRDYPESAVVVREGETSNRFFLIGSGRVRVYKNFGQTGQVELATLGPKDFFGEMCILETLPRSATVQAVAPSTLFTISSLAFHNLYLGLPAQHSILLLNIARDLSRRIRRLDEIFAGRH